MSFVYALALAVGLLVAAPIIAHRLRRRRATEQPFAPAKLVSPSPPRVRRRARLEDKALLATRAIAVALLALLGASPLVRCSRLSLERRSGASVALAIIIDDSMSMRVAHGSQTRLDRAKEGARELLGSVHEGDAVAVVLAGSPARVALAATTDLRAARAAVDAIQPSDRATDLDAAIGLGNGLISALPQIDRRVVVLSDLADGNPGGRPLGEGAELAVWVPLTELRGKVDDCAVMSADNSGTRVRVSIACSPGARSTGREVTLSGPDNTVIARAPAPSGGGGDVDIVLPENAPRETTARLTGSDAIASDDAAPVVASANVGAVAVVVDVSSESAATGGAPIVEQALAALKLDIAVRPIPTLPDRVEDLLPFAGILLDDPPGFTPEQRHALDAYLDQGGVVLVPLGPRAAAAPLGASLEPLLAHGVTWVASPVSGADRESVAGPFAETQAGLVDLGAKKRVALAPDDARAFEVFVRWKDGEPLVLRRAFRRGEAWLTTLPFAVDESDFTLQPSFLALLDAWVSSGRDRAQPLRTEVGATWVVNGADAVTAKGPQGPVVADRQAQVFRFVPSWIGAYSLTIDGKVETRVAAPVLRELDTAPREVAPAATAAIGDTRAAIDVSAALAVVLLAAVAVEMALRLVASRRAALT